MVNRDQVLRDLRAGMLPVAEIARRAGCSVRTVYRIAGEARREPWPLPEATGASPFQDQKPQTEAEAKKSLSALIAELEEYYKED